MVCLFFKKDAAISEACPVPVELSPSRDSLRSFVLLTPDFTGNTSAFLLCRTKPWRIIIQHGRPAAYYLNCALRSTSVEVNRSPFFKAPLKRKRPMCVSMSRCTLCIYLYHPWCLFLSVENSGLTRNFHPPLESPRLASNLTPRDFKIMCLHCQNLLLWRQLVIIKDLLSGFNESPRR